MKKFLVVALIVVLALAAAFVVFVKIYQHMISRNQVPGDVVDEDRIVLRSNESFSGRIINQTGESVTIKPIVVGSIDVTYTFTYDEIADIVFGRDKVEGLMTNPPMKGYFEVEKFKERIQALYRDGRFEQLENEAASLRKSRARFGTGEWKIDIFYIAIVDVVDSEFIPSLEANIERLKEWERAFPESITATILLIAAHKDLAWEHRGATSSGGVSAKGMGEFKRNLEIAQAYIDGADESLAGADPRFQYSRVAVGVGLGTIAQNLQDIFSTSVAYDPEYYSIYTRIAPFLMPRWGGRPGGVEQYADGVSTLTEGEEMYARVADSIRGYAEESAYRKFTFEWGRIQSGFSDMATKYPSNFYLLHANMWMACYYGDAEVARTLGDRNGYAWNRQAHEVWESFSKYYDCKTWAGSGDPGVSALLHREIRKGNYDEFIRTLGSGVDLNAKDDDGETALYFAIQSGFYDFAAALIDAGADVEMRSGSGDEPIHAAARNGAARIVVRLLVKGASVNAQSDKLRWTPLHYAARYGRIGVAHLLMAKEDIDVNMKNSGGATPLYLAVDNGKREIVGLLLGNASTDVNIASIYNQTPLNIAEENGYADIVTMLELKGAVANANVIDEKARALATNLNSRGTEEHHKGDYAKAKEFYLKAIEANPNYSVAYGNLALINMFENDFQACFANTSRAIELDSVNAHAQYSAAQCLFMLGKPKGEYLPYYRRYIELEPDNFRTKELYGKYPELAKSAN